MFVCGLTHHYHTVYLQVYQSVLSPVYVVCLSVFGSFVCWSDTLSFTFRCLCQYVSLSIWVFVRR